MPLIVGWAGGGVGGHPLIWSGGVALAAGEEAPGRSGWCRLRSTRWWRPPPPRPLRRCFPAVFLQNEADIKSLFPSKNNYIWDLILVNPRQQNHVQLDPVNPRLCAASIPCRTSPRKSCPVKLWKRSGRRVSRLMFRRYPSRTCPGCRSLYPPSASRRRRNASLSNTKRNTLTTGISNALWSTSRSYCS